jgi:hypothetical protein
MTVPARLPPIFPSAGAVLRRLTVMVLMVTRPASGPAAAASWLPSDRVTGLTDVMLALLFDPGSARRPASAGTRRAGFPRGRGGRCRLPRRWRLGLGRDERAPSWLDHGAGRLAFPPADGRAGGPRT